MAELCSTAGEASLPSPPGEPLGEPLGEPQSCGESGAGKARAGLWAAAAMDVVVDAVAATTAAAAAAAATSPAGKAEKGAAEGGAGGASGAGGAGSAAEAGCTASWLVKPSVKADLSLAGK